MSGRFEPLFSLFTVLLAVLLFSTACPPALAETGFVVVQPNQQLFPGGGRASGPYHSGEAPSGTQKGWLALIQKDGQWHLAKTTMVVQKAFDVVLDAEGEPPTGLLVASKEFPDALLMLKHPALKAGPLTAADQAIWDLTKSNGKPELLLHSFTLNDEVYWLELISSDSAEDGDMYKPDKLFMHSLKPQKPSISMSEIKLSDEWQENAKIQSIWAGDLDKDGLPDFLVWQGGYNFSAVCLHLSSISRPESDTSLPPKAGCQIGVGC